MALSREASTHLSGWMTLTAFFVCQPALNLPTSFAWWTSCTATHTHVRTRGRKQRTKHEGDERAALRSSSTP